MVDILIVDDEEDICSLIQGILEDEGYQTRQANDSTQAFDSVKKKKPDLVILDIWLQGSDKDGLNILSELKEEHRDLPVLMISGHGTIETAVSAIKMGAYDFIEKPFKADRLLLMIERAIELSRLRAENQTLKQKTSGSSEIIGGSSALGQVKQILERVSPTNSRILFTGEAGTGKEVAARHAHHLSERHERPFLALNCAILHPERLELELFGSDNKSGVLEQADEGTLLLDEVSDMPLETQGKILRVLQDQRFQRVGGEKQIEVDVRFMASTNHNLEHAIAKGSFREDLYYRLNVVPVHIPSLRERKEDIRELVEYFITLYSKQSGRKERVLTDEALIAMQSYDWPGNIRQLRNVVEWIMIMGNTDTEIAVSHLPPEITQGKNQIASTHQDNNFMTMSLRQAREEFERSYLTSQLRRFDGNISKAAKFIGMERAALHRKLKSLDISSSDKQDKEQDINQLDRKRA